MKSVGIVVLSALVMAGCATTSAYPPTASGTPYGSPTPYGTSYGTPYGASYGTPYGNSYVTGRAGQSAAQRSADVTTCDQVARDQTHRGAETAKGAGVGAVGGALAGAAAGAAIGAATGGDVGKSAGIGAGVGAVGGAAAGAGYKYSQSKDVYNAAFAQCMDYRGYSVTY